MTASGTLYTVATPIGNLGDMTYRAIEVLGQVDAIICEDTRQLRVLLDHYQVVLPQLIVYHAQSSDAVIEQAQAQLQAGRSLALVCDRGTPGISDPGARLITAVVQGGHTVVPIPGPSAVITALQAAGVHTESFWWRGFIPHKKGRQTFLQTALDCPATVVFYESPHRIIRCLEQLVELGAGDRPVVVARELTKQFEEFLRGTANDILTELTSRPAIKGEFVVILDQPAPDRNLD